MSWSVADSSLDLRTLQSAYASGELDPERLIEALYQRIAHPDHQRRDPNVWIHLVPKEEALARARALGPYTKDARLPLWGVPFAVKDNIDVAGLPTTAACPDFAYVPERSSPAVERLLAAGALCLGKTNLDQFATGLVGTRSPYGACRNVFNSEYLSGGSSSGSAVAVAAGHVSFALATDTAGSGRVPAALNNVVGLKPSRGLLSTEGMLAACRSLDCMSVMALGCEDAARVRELMQDAGSPLARIQNAPPRFRFGTPRASQLEFFGDTEAEQRYHDALDALREIGGSPVEIDWSPFAAIGDLLYGGPWLAERVIAVGDFIRQHPNACLPNTRNIIMAGERYSAADAFRAFYHLDELRAQAERVWNEIEVLVVPTTPTIYKVGEDERDPRLYNDRLGIYTRFANFLSYPTLALPAGFKANGLPFGITLVMPRGKDRELDAFGLAFERKVDVGAGRARSAMPRSDRASQRPPAELSYVRLAVVGAHLRGLPLNYQLIEAGARFVKQTRTAAAYKLFVLAGTKPLKPGLLRVSAGGAPIEVELWDVPSTTFGGFVDAIPAPLGIGNLQCEDGQTVKGFVCESYALEGAQDITAHGGFRAYLATQNG
jgi:allophanate hydrolase